MLAFSLTCICLLQRNEYLFASGFAPTSITRHNVPLSSISIAYSTSSSDELQSAIDVDALTKLESCRTRSAANKVLNQALQLSSSSPEQSNNNRLYGSVKIPRNLSSRPISDAELSLQTRTINSKYKIYDLIEQNGDRDIDRASLAVLCVFVAGASSAIVAQQTTQIEILGTVVYIPEIIRFLIVWALCFSPLVLVGYGLALPTELSATLVSIQRRFFPSYRKRMIQHEAGHFLVGHLLGWPVKTYQANNAVKNAVEFYPLSDEDVGKDRARALGFDARRSSLQEEATTESLVTVEDRPYFSKEGQGGGALERSVFRDKDLADASTFALSPQDDPTATWPFRGFDDETIDKLAVISVAGACAEILAYGNAEGGVADLVQLRRIYGASASAKKSSDDDGGDAEFGSFSDDATKRRLRRENGSNGSGMDEKEMDNRTRFALGYAMGLLRQNLGALDALAETMEQEGSVVDCIVALESCKNVRGFTLKGDYDKIRRERFQAEERGLGGWVEQTFLGGSKTIDVEDSSVIEGKGGGERRQKFQLTGDDPIYAAVAVSLAFAAFAFNGGITLH
jgi:hypothetical protein